MGKCIKCIKCNKVYKGKSGLHYHDKRHHGHTPRRYRRRANALVYPNPIRIRDRTRPPLLRQNDLSNIEDELLILPLGNLQFRISTYRAQDILYASGLGDCDAEEAARWFAYELSLPDLPKRRHDPTIFVDV